MTEWPIIGLGIAAILLGGWWLIRSVIKSGIELGEAQDHLKDVLEQTKRNEEAERNRPTTSDDAIDRL